MCISSGGLPCEEPSEEVIHCYEAGCRKFFKKNFIGELVNFLSICSREGSTPPLTVADASAKNAFFLWHITFAIRHHLLSGSNNITETIKRSK